MAKIVITQTNFNEYIKSDYAYDYADLKQLTVMVEQGVSTYRLGIDGVTRIVSTSMQYENNKFKDRHLVFKGEFLYAEISGTPTVEKIFLED